MIVDEAMHAKDPLCICLPVEELQYAIGKTEGGMRESKRLEREIYRLRWSSAECEGRRMGGGMRERENQEREEKDWNQTAGTGTLGRDIFENARVREKEAEGWNQQT